MRIKFKQHNSVIRLIYQKCNRFTIYSESDYYMYNYLWQFIIKIEFNGH